MTLFRGALLSSMAAACLPVPIGATTFFGRDFQKQNVYANTYVSLGANSFTAGNVFTGDVGTTGASSTITGNFSSTGAGNISANAVVAGNMQSGGVATTGASSTVAHDLTAGGAISIGAGSSVGSQGALNPADAAALTATKNAVAQEVAGAQTAFAKLGAGTLLDATITTDRTLLSGVYSAANLSTTAGTTLTLDGQTLADQLWVFNITDILATGASSSIVLINAGANSSIIWNTGGYASLGASSTFLGTIFADTYVSVGANANVANVGGTCGAIYSATSYVSSGDGAKIGSAGCTVAGGAFALALDGTAIHLASEQIPPARPPLDSAPVPEPATWGMIIVGFGLTGLALRSRRARSAAGRMSAS